MGAFSSICSRRSSEKKSHARPASSPPFQMWSPDCSENWGVGYTNLKLPSLPVHLKMISNAPSPLLTEAQISENTACQRRARLPTFWTLVPALLLCNLGLLHCLRPVCSSVKWDSNSTCLTKLLWGLKWINRGKVHRRVAGISFLDTRCCSAEDSPRLINPRSC